MTMLKKEISAAFLKRRRHLLLKTNLLMFDLSSSIYFLR